MIFSAIIVSSLLAISPLPALSTEAISTSEPILKRIDGTRLVQVKASSQVMISLELQNSYAATPYIAIIEVRDNNGITTYLQYQKGTILEESSIELGISWVPEQNGNYTLRAFVLSDFVNPVILSTVRESGISVSLIDVEYVEPEQTDAIEEESLSSEIDDTLTELRQHALEKINEDRADHDLPPVELSLNEAAQIHADDVLTTREISHWMTNGEKPYMTYSRYDGVGDVAQNVAVAGYKEDYDECVSGEYLCATVDPFEEIESGEYNMMYEDKECCDNGHRDNILNKYHTHVSIGIAYDDYFFVMVQNFENQYISWTDEIDDDNPDSVTMAGSYIRNTDAVKSNDVKLYTINILYDPLPTESIYAQYYQRQSYEAGELIAVVVEPLAPGWYYETPEGHDLIEADKWNTDAEEFEIEFSLEEITEKYGEGVYTVTVWCEDENAEQFIAAGIALFYS